jgi:hypothetical protein
MPDMTRPDITRRFTGWPERAFDVLLQLDGDPPAAVRERNRKDRERLVRQPMIALLQDVADADEAYDDFSVWGYGNTAWWWQHQCGVVRTPGRLEFGLRFDLDGLDISGGWQHSEVERFRAAVANDETGSELTRILDSLKDKGIEVSGDVMKRHPRGYPPGHLRDALLRHRSLQALLPLGCDDWLHTPAAVDRVLDAFAQLGPLMSWLDQHVAIGG